MNPLTRKTRETGAPTEWSDIDILVHIGIPKTGSSAVQRFCLKNRRALARAGFHYPDHPIDKNGVSGGHSFISGPLIKGNLDLAHKNLQKALEDAHHNGCTLLISSEGFYRQCDNLMACIGGYRIGMIAFFRDPVEMLLSGYNQQVKRHGMTLHIDTFLRRQANSNEHHIEGGMLEDWADRVGDSRCVVRAYPRGRGTGETIEGAFVDALGIGEREKTRFRIDRAAVNRSYVASALELKRLMNSVIDSNEKDINRRVDALLQAYSDRERRRGREGSMWPSVGAERAVRQRFTETNSRLGARFPALRDQNAEPESKSEGNVGRGYARFDLQGPLRAIRRREGGVEAELIKRIDSALQNGNVTTVLCRLATLMGVDAPEPATVRDLFPKERLERLLWQNNQAPDYLRELAVAMEVAGELEWAALFIERAREKRPGGGGILRIQERVERKRGIDDDQEQE